MMEENTSDRVPLTENDKIQILLMLNMGVTSCTQIGQMILPMRKESTVRNFVKRYIENRRLSPQRGRKPKKTNEIKMFVAEETKSNRKEPSSILAEKIEARFSLEISDELVRQLRHENGFVFLSGTISSPLDFIHMQKRINFARGILSDDFEFRNYPIVFTDESMIAQDINFGKFWRGRFEHCDEFNTIQEHHPLAVMVWGGIGLGYRTPLFRCCNSITAQTYCTMLDEDGMIEHINSFYGALSYLYQQDGARPHTAKSTITFLREKILLLDNWPPYSPDLSPIEMVWSFIKKALRGNRFNSSEQLFAAIEEIWNNLSQEYIDSLVSSFPHRLQVTIEIDGKCLNGHWSRVHHLHHDQMIDN
jgi:transposase